MQMMEKRLCQAKTFIGALPKSAVQYHGQCETRILTTLNNVNGFGRDIAKMIVNTLGTRQYQHEKFNHQMPEIL